jgi:ATP-binding protein involved in chromosome partitioning
MNGCIPPDGDTDPMSDPQAILAAAGRYHDPLIGKTLAEAGAGLNMDGAVLRVILGFPAAGYRAALAAALRAHLAEAGAGGVEVTVDWEIRAGAVQKGLQTLPGVKNILAVASGKGGVGKSTVAVNLALALRAEGAQVGILDADLYGPSQPLMLGTHDKPTSPDGRRMNPIRAHGLQAMSIGFLMQSDAQPTIWRGPMATQALWQLLTETVWEALDYLVVDMPPGTGDIQLSLSQKVPVAGSVIVTTPQDIALLDARKGLEMFRKVGIPVLGIVENMSIHVCSKCGHEEHIFGSGGGERLAHDGGTELLGSLPLDIRIREQADSGNPTVAQDPGSPLALRYRDIARLTAARLAYGAAANVAFPTIEISD